MLTTGSVNYAGEVRSTIQCLVSPGAKLPERQHHWDAGADLFACLEDSKTIYLEPGQQQLVDTQTNQRQHPTGVGVVEV